MTDPGLALHIALLAKLKDALSVSVWDAVPQSAEFPYVTIDSVATDNADLLRLRVTNRFVYLGVWSRSYGQAEVMEIMSQIDGLNEQPLVLSTGSVVSLRVERMRTVREPDNLTYQGQVTLRVITQH